MKPDLLPTHFVLPILCLCCCFQAIYIYNYKLILPELPNLNHECYMGELIKTSNGLKIKLILLSAILNDFKIFIVVVVVVFVVTNS